MERIGSKGSPDSAQKGIRVRSNRIGKSVFFKYLGNLAELELDIWQC
jgi:hypothetical protein